MNRVIPLFSILFLVTLVYGANVNPNTQQLRRLGVATSAKFTLADHSSQFRQSLPRYNIKFEPVSSNFEPSDHSYLQSIGLISGFGLIPAVIVFLSILIYSICGVTDSCMACCCSCCKKDDDDDDDEKKPCCPRLGRMIVYVVFVLCGIFFCAALGFGAVGSSDMEKVVKAVENDVVKTSGNLEREAAMARSGLASAIGYTPSESLRAAQAEWAKVQLAVDGVGQDVASKSEGLKNIEAARVAVYGVFAAVMSLTLTVGIYLAYRGHTTLLLFTIYLGALSSCLMFLSFGAHLGLSVMMSDVCRAADSIITTTAQRQPPAAVAAGLANYLSCPTKNITAVLLPLSAQMYSSTRGVNEGAVASNPITYAIMTNGTNNTSQLRTLPTTPAPCFCPCDSLPVPVNHTLWSPQCGPTANVHSPECSLASLGGQAGQGGDVHPLLLQLNSTAEVDVRKAAGVLLQLNATRDVLLRIRDCSFISTPLENIASVGCDTGMQALDFLWASSLVLALFLGIFSFTLKRSRMLFERDDSTPVPRSKYYQRHPDRYNNAKKKEKKKKKKGGWWSKANDQSSKKKRDMYYDMKL